MKTTLLLLLLLASPCRAATTLVWTNPSFSAAVDESGGVFCDPGSVPAQDLRVILIYRQFVTGGPAQVCDSVLVAGRAGRVDSIVVDEGPGAWFYVIPVDSSGNRACASPRVYRGPITNVPTEPSHHPYLVRRFDVLGRLVKEPRGHGAYFWRAYYRDGRIVSGKGRPPEIK